MQRGFMRAMVGIYRRTGGRIGGRVGPTPVLLLTTTGRRSDASHTVAVGYFDHDDIRFVVASNAGAPRHPAWHYNLNAHPEVQVEGGRETYRAVARVAAGEERARSRLWRSTAPSERPGDDHAAPSLPELGQEQTSYLGRQD